MRNKIAKKFRKLINPQDAITRRAYRRIKKHYARLSAKEKPVFMKLAETMFGGSKDEET